MTHEDFLVAKASWLLPSDQDAIRQLRREVFVMELGLPASLEADEADEAAVHVLARNHAGKAIGSARLTASGQISRVLVTPAWRQHGVSRALLELLFLQAHGIGLAQVQIHAHADATPFYTHLGFHPKGAPFIEAGLEYQTLWRSLSAEAEITDKKQLPDASAQPGLGRLGIEQARLHVLGQTRHELAIYLPCLTAASFARAEEAEQCRRIATSGRGARIRVLLHEANGALRQGHQLLRLAQRLPSVVTIRRPIEEQDLAYRGAYLLNDDRGYLFQPDAEQAWARAELHDGAGQAPLRQHFNEVWERSVAARELMPLDL